MQVPYTCRLASYCIRRRPHPPLLHSLKDAPSLPELSFGRDVDVTWLRTHLSCDNPSHQALIGLETLEPRTTGQRETLGGRRAKCARASVARDHPS